MIGLRVEVESSLQGKHPGLMALATHVHELTILKTSAELEALKKEVNAEVRAKYTLEKLKDLPIIHSYRDFFWRVGIDPTKIRPAAEALIRRILAGKDIPTINTLVDAYNLASIKTCVALAAFDESRLQGSLLMRSAKAQEDFLGIGMEKPMLLGGGEIVVADAQKLVAVYPYRDAYDSRVTDATRKITLMVCGCPGIDEETLIEAETTAAALIMRFNTS
jgi:DNA/RNA-binding domain of Phe-tRNA-synthetase-like protein